MSENNNFSDVWEGLSNFWEKEEGKDWAKEQPPASQVYSSVAQNRQILNILFIIDVSGSMRGKRIGQVNYALENIFKELKRRDDANSTIKIGILEFAATANWTTSQPVPLDDFVFTQINATHEVTNYGTAFDALNQKLRREEFLNPNLGEYFAPLILFLTDGEPLDPDIYPQKLLKLKDNGWFRKSAKYAIAVGEDAKNEEIGTLLSEFTGVRENVRYADEGAALVDLVQYIAIRASEVQTSMLSGDGGDGGINSKSTGSIFSSVDDSLFSSIS